MVNEILLIEIVAAMLTGLLIGSFLNVCIFRLPRDLSVLRPARSFCPCCEKTIAWYDNIPVASYVILGGRCRNCKAHISLRYPVVELATAAAFVVCILALGLSLDALKFALYSAIMITLIASDLEERILPDEFTLGGTIIGLVIAAFVPLEPGFAYLLLGPKFSVRWLSVGEAALGAGLASGIIWFVGWAYSKIRGREGLGFGDVKMIATIGAFMGLKWALLTLIVGSMLGSIVGLLYIFIARKDSSTYELPFGSFLGIAALAVAVYSKFVT